MSINRAIDTAAIWLPESHKNFHWEKDRHATAGPAKVQAGA